MSWHPELVAMGVNAYFCTCNNNYFYMFPPLVFFNLQRQDKCSNSCTRLANPNWYLQLLQMNNQDPLFFRLSFDIATRTLREPPIMRKTAVNSNQGNNTTEIILEASLKLLTNCKYNNYIKN